MASSVSSAALVPISALALRAAPVRPADAGLPALFDPAASRQSQAQAEPLPQQDQAQSRDGAQADTGAQSRTALSGDSAPFLAQLLNQDQPPPKQPSLADATRAYARFREEPQSGFVLDEPARVDVKV